MASVSRLPTIYFEKLLESSPDIVVAVDIHGTISFYNDGARQTRMLKQQFAAVATVKGGIFLKGAPAVPGGRGAAPAPATVR